MIDKSLLARNLTFNDNRYLRVDGSNAVTSGGTAGNFAYIELYLGFQFAYASYFKDLTYDTSGNLTTISIYSTSAMTKRLFNKTLSYDTSGNLITVKITRDSDGTSITKILAYDSSGNLDTITVTYA